MFSQVDLVAVGGTCLGVYILLQSVSRSLLRLVFFYLVHICLCAIISRWKYYYWPGMILIAASSSSLNLTFIVVLIFRLIANLLGVCCIVEKNHIIIIGVALFVHIHFLGRPTAWNSIRRYRKVKLFRVAYYHDIFSFQFRIYFRLQLQWIV